MESLAEVTEEQLRAALDPTDVRGLQVLQAALGSGVLLFGAMIGFLATQRPAEAPLPTPEQIEQLRIFSIVNATLAVSMLGAVAAIGKAYFSRARLESLAKQDLAIASAVRVTDPAQKCVHLLRGWTILRLALFEGSALFGLVVVFLGLQQGALAKEPLLALNGVTALVQLLHVAATFPSAERLVRLFRASIAQG